MHLTIQNISLQYDKTPVLTNLNADLVSGELIGLLGPNGAGKTSLLKILTTLQSPNKGDILLNGKSIIKRPKLIQKVLGYLPQQIPYFPNLTAVEYLNYVAVMKGVATNQIGSQIKSLLDRLHLSKTGHKKLKDFSGGMRQRVGIAATLLNNPPIIIADEPTAGLDPQERVSLRNLLAELANDHLVLVSTHIVSDIEAVANQILLLQSGQFLYRGTPTNLMTKSNGYVWEYPLPHSKPSLIESNSSLIQRSNGIQVRVLSKTSPQASAQSVTPTLEDACLGIFSGVIPL